jgi:hypothetical protein
MTDQELIDHINKCLVYNPDTGVFTYKVSRGPRKQGDVAGSINPNGYRQIGVGPKGFHKIHGAHRIAFLLMEGRWPYVIDHVNGIKDDNRWENIRECTTQQNCMNTSSRRGSSSKYRGVHKRVTLDSMCNRKEVWIAGIYFDKKKKHLGYFDNERDAARAYNAAAEEHFGEFAKLNVID